MSQMNDELLARLKLRLGVHKRRDLVRRIGVSQSTMNRWKNGTAHPSGLARQRLAKVLSNLDKLNPVEPGKHDRKDTQSGQDWW